MRYMNNSTEIGYIQNRNDKVIQQSYTPVPIIPVIPKTTSLPSFAPKMPPSPTYPQKYEFENEYSEIGSVTADSGRGDSLTGHFDEKHYAQVTY